MKLESSFTKSAMAEVPVPEPPRVFADASVLIAGAASYTGASRALLTLAELGLITLITCPYVQEETRRNLALKLPDALPYFDNLHDSIPWEQVDDPPQEAVETWMQIIREKDAPVLAAAVSAAPNRFVTLDKADFLDAPAVAERSGINICTPGELMREIRHILAEGLIDSD